MIFTELYRNSTDEEFQESELYLDQFSIFSARKERQIRNYVGTTELTVCQGEDYVCYYVKESPNEINEIIKAEDKERYEDD